jgi:transcription elongation GreA/GreB family factor
MIEKMAESEKSPTKDRAAEEELFVELLRESAGDLPRLFAITREMKKRGEKEKPRLLLQRLAESQREQGLFRERIDTLLEIARAFPARCATVDEMADAFRDAYAEHPSVEDLLSHYLKPKAAVAEAAEKLKRWFAFVPGEVYYFAGRGAGRVIDLKPAIESVRFEFENGQKLNLPPGAAANNLVALPPGDFRRMRFEQRGSFAERCLANPGAALEHLITSNGAPLSAAEIKDAFAGLIPAEKWASFWNTAKKQPQLRLSGSGKNARYAWAGSAAEADESVRDEFDRADPAGRLTIARQHVRRSGLASYFLEKLRETAVEIRDSDPARALEIVFLLEESAPGTLPPFSSETLLRQGGADRARGLSDPALRIRAYRILRNLLPQNWPELYGALFSSEEDSRALAFLDAALAEEAEPARKALAEKIFKSPRLAPRAFLWLCEKRSELPQVSGLLGAPLLASLLEALRLPEFSNHRAKLKALFDRGGLAIELVASVASEEDARRVWKDLERAPGLEDFRREDLKLALVRAFPGLRGPRVEPMYVTPESLVQRRSELETLVSVEIPKNGRAIQEAAAMGDLSENFEYHAARARQEFLSARAATLQQELSRARPLDPAKVDVSEVRVGARVKLVSGNEAKLATILGPWDSNPEAAVYSYQSEFAQKLLGRKKGESVDIEGRTWEVAEIRPWKD